MQTELQRQHERHKAFLSSIATRASQLAPPVVKHSYDIPNVPYGTPKRIPKRPARIKFVRPEPADLDYEDAWYLALCGQDKCEPTPERITIRRIQNAICRHFDIRFSDLISHFRMRRYMRPRLIGYALAREIAHKSLPDIGRAFGGRDHSTVLSGLRRITVLVDRGDAIGADIEAIRGTL